MDNERQVKLVDLQYRMLCAAIEMEAMKADNYMRMMSNEPLSYGEHAFMNLINMHSLGVNDVYPL